MFGYGLKFRQHCLQPENQRCLVPGTQAGVTAGVALVGLKLTGDVVADRLKLRAPVALHRILKLRLVAAHRSVTLIAKVRSSVRPWLVTTRHATLYVCPKVPPDSHTVTEVVLLL